MIDAALAFARARKRSAVVYFLEPDEPIGTPNVREVAETLDGDLEELDVVIDSIGGDIHAAYQLISLLRLRAKRVYACVPRYARSAATLICVGADQIYLDDLAALGPLDAQLWEGTVEGGNKYNSALNPFKGLERLRDFSLETLQSAADVLYESGVHRTDEVLKHAMEFVRVTTASLFDKIQSHRLGEYSQALAIGEEYGRRLLARTLPDLSAEGRETILKRLVHEYPSHEFVIDCQELRELGLQAELFTDEERSAARRLATYSGQRCIGLVKFDGDGDGGSANGDGAAARATFVTGTNANGRPQPAGHRHVMSGVGYDKPPPNPWRRRVKRPMTG
jgi:hypothetical protein